MVRSGSTWSFNVALTLVESCDPSHKTFSLYDDNLVHLPAAARPRQSNLVVKSHVLDEFGRQLCRSGAIRAIYTWRHPYDAIASAVRKFGHSADHYLETIRNSLRTWSFHRSTGTACILSYEDIVGAPEAGIHSIAAYLHIDVEPARIREIADALSMKKLKKFADHIDQLEPSRVVRKDGKVYDRQTLLHQNHIQDGRIGYGISLLSAEERSRIDTMLKEEGFDFLRGRVRVSREFSVPWMRLS